MFASANTPNGQLTRLVFISFGLILGFFALWLIRDIALLTLTAIIIAILLTTPVRFFVRHGVSRPFAVLLTLMLMVAVLVISTSLLLPDLFEQFRLLAVKIIPDASARLQEELQPAKLTARFPFLKDVDLTGLSNQLSQQLVGGLADITLRVFPFVGSLASALLSILVIIFLAVYFIADPGTHQRGVLKLVPLRYRHRAREIMVRLDETLRRFLQAQIVLMLLIGFTTALALGFLNVPLAGALGTITGLFSFVPNFGPLIALIPTIAVAILNAPERVLLVIFIFFLIQFIYSQVVTPLLFGQEINMPPAIILLSQIVGGIFFGFLGLLLAVPLAAIVMVLIREIYVKDILGDVGRDELETMEMHTMPAPEPAKASGAVSLSSPASSSAPSSALDKS